MKSPRLSRYTLSISVAAALLAGCGGSQSPIGAPGAIPQSHSFSVHFDHKGSWMAPGAPKDDLLYITNHDTVTVYSYPKGRHVGTLKGFYNPEAECVDKAGDVFISDNDTVTEYPHASTKPTRTLTFSGYFAGGCSSDPTTGNLAVGWIEGFYGYVAVYKNATGSPTLYQSPNMALAYCGYDVAGNLFVDGAAYFGDELQLAELPKNGNGLETITLSQTIYTPGPVQWDGEYLAVGDNATETIYQFVIAGSNGTREGTTALGDGQHISQWWIAGNKVVGSSGISPYVTWYWKYTAGGAPIKTLSLKGVDAPFAATLSKANKKELP